MYSESDYFDENTQSLPNFVYEFDPNLTESQYFESNTFNPIYSEYEYQSISGDESGSELNNFDEITIVNNKNKDIEEGKEYKQHKEINIEKEKEINNIIEENTSPEPEQLKKIDENLEQTSSISESSKQDLEYKDQDYITTITIEDTSSPEIKVKNKSKKSNSVKRQNSLRKPLTFITKNISRAFGEKDNKSKKNKSLPVETDPNQLYSSLPDINASKYLEKCERIDRKLRKCDKYPHNSGTKNRFVVNIGQHLNLKDNKTSIPVDFEIKISKIPKKKENAINETDKNNNDKYLLPQTLLNQNLRDNCIEVQSQEKTKHKILPKITEVIEKKDIRPVKTIRNYSKIDEKPVNTYVSITKPMSPDRPISRQSNSLPIDIPKQRVIEEQFKEPQMDLDIQEKRKEKKSPSPPNTEQEYQEKIDTMRCFWNKMMDNVEEDEKEEEQEEPEKPISPKLVISHFENLSNGKTSPKPEPCKIVDVQSKVENVRKFFEQFPEKPKEIGPSLVETNKKIFEPKVESKAEKTFVKESCEIFESSFFPLHSDTFQYESLNPNIVEIVERHNTSNGLKSEANGLPNETNGLRDETDLAKRKMNGCVIKKNNTLLRTKDLERKPEFDHVRYKVMKSDLFQKNIFANYEKESQFDGLMQYLQDYSFQELLIDNNIVIIEPIRTKVEYQDSQKKQRKLAQIIPKINQKTESKESSLKRHFFYHPIRVNREINDDELPNPDTVKQVRQIFENPGIMERSQSSKELDNNPIKKTIRYQTLVDPDRDQCSDISDASDKNSCSQNTSRRNSSEQNLESFEDEKQYISEDILKKIRDCGTCITYYGGKILKRHNSEQLSPMTKAIMEEIRGWQRRNEECGCKKRGIRKNSEETNDSKDNRDAYQGVKFKLIKSNSCSSRLELVGTENLSEYRKKFLEKQKQIIEEQNLKNDHNGNEKTLKDHVNKENKINGNEKELNSPKIVGEEKKLNKGTNQWIVEEEMVNNNTVTIKTDNKKLDDFKHYEVRKHNNKYDDMEFEHFEVLEK